MWKASGTWETSWQSQMLSHQAVVTSLRELDSTSCRIFYECLFRGGQSRIPIEGALSLRTLHGLHFSNILHIWISLDFLSHPVSHVELHDSHLIEWGCPSSWGWCRTSWKRTVPLFLACQCPFFEGQLPSSSLPFVNLCNTDSRAPMKIAKQQ